MIKKVFSIFIILLAVVSSFEFFFSSPIKAQSDLEKNITEQVQDLNINELNKLFSSGEYSFEELFNNIINGNFSFDINFISNHILNIVSSESKQIVSTFILIFVICVIGYILFNISSNNNSSNVGSVIHLGLMGIIASLIISFLFSKILEVKGIFSQLKQIMEISFPILLTLMASSGATSSVSILQPIMALLSSSIIEVFINVLLPLFIVIVVINIADNLSNNVKLSHFSGFLSKTFKWSLGLIFGTFSALLGVFGITANSYDTLMFKTAKYSIKNYIPFVGGYLSSGLSIITCSSILIKNAVGLAVFVLTLISILKPILSILILKLFLNLLAAMLQNIADKKMIDFLTSISKALNMLIAIICAFCAMFLIFLSLCISVGNYI